MKTHLFNLLEIKMIGLSRVQQNQAELIFDKFVKDFGFSLQKVYKPSTLCNMKLIGGDREDFKAIATLVREELYKLIRRNNIT